MLYPWQFDCRETSLAQLLLGLHLNNQQLKKGFECEEKKVKLTTANCTFPSNSPQPHQSAPCRQPKFLGRRSLIDDSERLVTPLPVPAWHYAHNH